MLQKKSETIREKLSDWLLSWAENQKPAKDTNWFLFELQQYRSLQRSLANTAFEKSRAPDDTKLEFIGFRLIEVFHYEDFSKVSFGLHKMFPGLGNSGNDSLENFEKNKEVLTTGLWQPVGTLFRDNPNVFGGARAFQRMSELHSSIKRVDVDVQKILPSMVIVSFDVQLDESATEQLVKLQSQKYLGKSRFEGISFGKYPSVNISILPSESVVDAALKNWVSKIRENVERNVKPYLSGYYMSSYSNRHHLPSIEIYVLSRGLSDQKKFSDWAKNAYQWGHSFGFNLSSRNLFGNDEYLFGWRNTNRDQEIDNAYKVIVFSEKSSKQPNSIWANSKYLFYELSPLIAIIEFLEDSQGVLEKIRHRIFSALNAKRSLFKYVKLYQDLQILSRIFQRLTLEIEQKMSFFGNGFFFRFSGFN